MNTNFNREAAPADLVKRLQAQQLDVGERLSRSKLPLHLEPSACTSANFFEERNRCHQTSEIASDRVCSQGAGLPIYSSTLDWSNTVDPTLAGFVPKRQTTHVDSNHSADNIRLNMRSGNLRVEPAAAIAQLSRRLPNLTHASSIKVATSHRSQQTDRCCFAADGLNLTDEASPSTTLTARLEDRYDCSFSSRAFLHRQASQPLRLKATRKLKDDLVHTRSREEGLKDQTPNLDRLAVARETVSRICQAYLHKQTGRSLEQADAGLLDLAGPEIKGNDPIESKYTARQVLAMCLQDKHGSIQVQRYLKQIDAEEAQPVIDLLTDPQHLNRLLTDRFGSYIIQLLVVRDRSVFNRVAGVVLGDSIELASNEFSSRIMQRMFQLDRDFSVRCFELMKDEFHQVITSFSGSILLAKLMPFLPSEACHAFVIKILEQNKEYLRKAYFNRMLSTLVSCCSARYCRRYSRGTTKEESLSSSAPASSTSTHC